MLATNTRHGTRNLMLARLQAGPAQLPALAVGATTMPADELKQLLDAMVAEGIIEAGTSTYQLATIGREHIEELLGEST